MNYQEVAKKIVTLVGGSENMISAAHCATRLRLVIADNSKVNKEALEMLDAVKGVFEGSGQLQIIIGTGAVNKVYDELVRESGISHSSKEDVKQEVANKMPWYKKVIKALGDVFVPIIPAIVASGLLMGLLGGMSNLFPEIVNNDMYTVLTLFSNTAFTFLPILIACSAAKTFGGNIYLGAVIGMIMIHPDLMNAWSVASAESVPTISVWFGLYDINYVGYQGHVIPVVIAVWFMCFIEKKLHKIVPEVLDLFITPLVTVLVTGYVTLTVIGPVFVYLENGILAGASMLIAIPFGIGGALCGALYAPTVVGGIHHMYNALEAGLLSSTGVNIWMPIATAANVAQGGAALAFAVKTRDKKLKSMAYPASFSAFLGITEPAIFGVNLRFMKPFIAGCIGGAAGGFVSAILNVSASAYGITGVFGLLITTNNILQYIIVMAVAFVVAFMMTMVLYKEKKQTDSSQESKNKIDNDKEELVILQAPIHGTIVKLEEVPDATFASGVLGSGIAIQPIDNIIYAPCDATIETITDSKHAIGMSLKNGAEILIHVGIDTVKLDGKGFELYVQQGDTIIAGQKLMKVDLVFMKEQGFSTITPIVVMNSDDYELSDMLVEGIVNTNQKIFGFN